MTPSSRSDQTEAILSAGFGGQGIMFIGKLIAHAGLLAGKEVTWMPSYGAEVRGGTSYSMTKISNGPIASPIIVQPDILIVMNKPSLVKYEPALRPGGVLIWNRSLIDAGPTRRDITAVRVPMTELAIKMGDAKCANMIAVGACAQHTKLIALKHLVRALEEAFGSKKDLFALNKEAMEKGHKL